jgi:DUF1365 family protein
MTGFVSALYLGSVLHTRLRPVRHRLRYPLPMLLLDLDELPRLDRAVAGFSFDRFNLFSFHGRDHLAGDATPLRAQIEQHLARAGLVTGGAIRVLCMPRVLGFAFNPLSVFFCHAPEGGLVAMLYEVNNTFGQRHSYLIPAASGGGLQRQRCEKRFYVSPFMEMALHYHFRVAAPGDRAIVSIEVHDETGPMLAASFSGRRQELTGVNLRRLLMRFPALGLQVLAGIHWEALKLWRKGLRLRLRPKPPCEPVSIVGPGGPA